MKQAPIITHGELERIGNKLNHLFPLQAEDNTPENELCGCHMADHYRVNGEILICPKQMPDAS